MTAQTALALRATSTLVITGLAVGTGTYVLARKRPAAQPLIALARPALLLFPLFCLADLVLLWALPHLRLSFSPSIGLPLLASTLVRLALFWGLLGASLLSLWPGRRHPTRPQPRSLVAMFLVFNVGFGLVQLDAYVVEPLWVETTSHSLSFDDLDAEARPVRVVHLTDTHIARNSFREANIVRRVNALEPDIIVLTGDYLNLSYLRDPLSAAHFRQFVGHLQAPHGIYAVRGSVEPHPADMERLVNGTSVTWLEQESTTIDIRGQSITIAGVACSHRQELDAARLTEAMASIEEEAFTLLLYHSPDLIREASELGVDLYLGGHTHGGQLRLPIYGAIVTGSRYGKQYTNGLFQRNGTQMYISRGLGFEGGGMPRARFLCRPEIVSIDVQGKGPTGTQPVPGW
jgi:predicted MPP superfamily phosphohydrolase